MIAKPLAVTAWMVAWTVLPGCCGRVPAAARSRAQAPASAFTLQWREWQHHNVYGLVTQSGQYCGGKTPEGWELRLPGRRRPVAGASFIARQGESNDARKPIMGRFATDGCGWYSVWLRPGIYCIVEAEPGGTHPRCVGRRETDCLHVLRVETYDQRSDSDGSFNIQQPCGWACQGAPPPG